MLSSDFLNVELWWLGPQWFNNRTTVVWTSHILATSIYFLCVNIVDLDITATLIKEHFFVHLTIMSGLATSRMWWFWVWNRIRSWLGHSQSPSLACGAIISQSTRLSTCVPMQMRGYLIMVLIFFMCKHYFYFVHQKRKEQSIATDYDDDRYVENTIKTENKILYQYFIESQKQTVTWQCPSPCKVTGIHGTFTWQQLWHASDKTYSNETMPCVDVHAFFQWVYFKMDMSPQLEFELTS